MIPSVLITFFLLENETCKKLKKDLKTFQFVDQNKYLSITKEYNEFCRPKINTLSN